MFTKRVCGFVAAAFTLAACSHGGTAGIPPTSPNSPHHRIGTFSISPAHTYTGVSNATQSVTVNLSPAPGVGDELVAVVYAYNGASTCYTVSAQTGWSTPFTDSCSGSPGRNAIWVFTHVVASGDSMAPAFSIPSGGSDDFAAVVYDMTGVDGAAPIDTVHAFANFSANATAQQTTTETPSRAGAYAIAAFATGYVKDPTISGTPSGWVADSNADSGVYLTTGHNQLGSPAAATGKATYTSGPASGRSAIIFVQPPSATPPPAHLATWSNWGGAASTTPANAPSIVDYAFTAIGVSTSACSTPCQTVIYTDSTITDPDSTGYDTDPPWRYGGTSNASGTCPEPSTAFFKSGKDAESWYLHSPGYSDAAHRIAAFYHQFNPGSPTNALYIWPMNVGSAGMQSYAQSVMKYCVDSSGGVANDLNGYNFMFQDNWASKMSANGSVFGSYGYTVQKDSGTATDVPSPISYASANCSNLYPGSNGYCTQSSQIAGGSDTSTNEFSSDSVWYSAMKSFVQGFKHADGAAYMTFVNACHNTDTTYWSVTNMQGCMLEHWVVQSGTPQYLFMMAQAVDSCATAETNSKYFVLEDTDPGYNGSILTVNTAEHQANLRLHFGIAWLCAGPYFIDDPDFEYATYQATGGYKSINAFPMDWYVPDRPTVTAPAATASGSMCGEADPSHPSGYENFGGAGAACNTGGIRSYCVSGTAPDCIAVREFTNCYSKTTFDNNSATASGPYDCAVVVNLTSSAQTIAQSWLTNASKYAHMVVPCTPSSAYFGTHTYTGRSTSVVCSAATGEDVNEGGAWNAATAVDWSFSIPSGDAVFLTSQ